MLEYHNCRLLGQGFRSPSWHSVKGPLEAGLDWFCSGRSEVLSSGCLVEELISYVSGVGCTFTLLVVPHRVTVAM